MNAHKGLLRVNRSQKRITALEEDRRVPEQRAGRL